MREIKFMVILKKEKTPRQAYWINFLEMTALVMIWWSYEWIEYKHIMQYTWLKDKNKREIYEGYIVEDISDHHWISDVFFKNWSWKIHWKCSDVWIWSWSKKLNIIWNIYWLFK